MLLMAVDFFAISRYGSSYILYCFASSRNGLCYSLWSLCHSVPPILYMVLVYLNIDTVRSHHRNIFLYLYILYNFFVHWVWVHFDNIVRSFHWCAFIDHRTCVVKKGNACVKSVFGHSIVTGMYMCEQWWMQCWDFHSLHWIATISFHNQTPTHLYSSHFLLNIKTSLSLISFYAK